MLDKSDLTATIVVCTRNRPAALRKCLEGVAQLERTPDEVIVVDNTSGDAETEAVTRECGAAYVVEPERGVSRARNRGMFESHSEIVAYLDDDVAFDTHWLGRILAPFKDPQVAVVAGRVITPESAAENGTGQTARFLTNKDREWFEIATFGGLLFESNMACRRKACAGRKIFDERLGRGAPFEIAEGHYALALLLSHGYTAVYLPDAIVFHGPFTLGEASQEARNRVAFCMLLFSEFPSQRLDLLRFLFRRVLRKPLAWQRETPNPGAIITSGWVVLLKASLRAVLLFFRTRKPRED